eukprot:Gb_29074 [translate_table: standard]
METEEIVMVLDRASELHKKLDDAIDRSIKADIEIHRTKTGPRVEGNEEDCVHEDELSQVGEGAVEARSLSSIRDALDVLEDQLDCLQILQQQQQAEKEVALADLEESRRILLERLRDHHGKEWEVVHEALAFAGEPVDEREDLPLPSYPMLLPDNPSFAGQEKEPCKYYDDPDYFRENNPMKLLALTEENDEELVSEVEDCQICEEEIHDAYVQKNKTKLKGAFRAVCQNIQRLGKPVGHAFALAAKTALVAASVATIVALSNARQNKKSKESILQVPIAPSSEVPSFEQPGKGIPLIEQKCPARIVMMSDDDAQKSVVKECIELHSQEEVKVPDVLHGLG